MSRVFRWPILGLGSLALLASLAVAAVPGPHRALTPALFDMVEVGERIYIDAADQGETAKAMIEKAEATTRDFFGALRTDPTYIICTTQGCADRFGLGTRGLALGYHLVFVGPGGLTELIFTHERLHIELHRFMSVSDIVNQRFPAWFDEGLASYVSGDTRLNRPANPRDADWIKAAHSFHDWSRITTPDNWRDTYGAAARLFEEIESQIGRDGVLTLITMVADGANFVATLSLLRRTS